MSAQPVEIQVFGRTLRVNCPPDQQAALNQAAEELTSRLSALKARSKVVNVEQLVFIVALNVCYELAEEKRRNADYASCVEQRIGLLQSTIEQALIDQSRLPDTVSDGKTTASFE